MEVCYGLRWNDVADTGSELSSGLDIMNSLKFIVSHCESHGIEVHIDPCSV